MWRECEWICARDTSDYNNRIKQFRKLEGKNSLLKRSRREAGIVEIKVTRKFAEERRYRAVRTKEGMTKTFRTTKGVRQGYVLSPLLFNLYIADMDKYMKRRRIRGIMIDNERLWSLAYADDIGVNSEEQGSVTGYDECFEKVPERQRVHFKCGENEGFSL